MSVRIRDLRPGDRLFMMSAASGEPDGATLISWSVPHPTYPGLALVVWRMADGRLSFDALHPEQHDVSGAVVVQQSEDERLASLRRAIDPPAIRVDSTAAEHALSAVSAELARLDRGSAVEFGGDYAAEVAAAQRASAAASDPMSEALLTIIRGAVWISTDDDGDDVPGKFAPPWMLRAALAEIDRRRPPGGHDDDEVAPCTS